MTVHVTMLISSLPEGYPQDERGTSFEDTGTALFEYSLHGSGSLVVWKREKGASSIEVVYGPAAWESVQGDSSASHV